MRRASFEGPNDLVFDKHGGLWFTDLGKRRAATWMSARSITSSPA